MFNEHPNKLITSTLRSVAVISILIMLSGLCLFMLDRDIKSDTDLTGIKHTLVEALNLEPKALMALGVMVLILTPFIRVAGFCLSFFFAEKDLLYGFISLGVLIILIAGMFIPGF